MRKTRGWALVFAFSFVRCGATPAARDPQKTGQLRVATTSGQLAGMPRTSTFFSGFFADTTTSSMQCTSRFVSICKVTTCVTAARDGDAGTGSGVPLVVRAGTITISGAGQSLNFSPSPEGGYPSGGSGTEEFFPAGTVVTMTAAGDAMGVPAFSGTVTMPARVTFSSPAVTTGTMLVLRRAQPFALAWSGGTTGNVTATIISTGTNRSVTAQCSFAATAGNGTVGPDVLSLLDAGPALLLLGAEDSRSLVAGDYTITLTAASTGITDSIVRATIE